MKNIVGYFGNVPVFYWPYFKKSLKDERSPWTIIPGRNNKFGKFLLTGYTMWFDNFLGGRLTPTLRFDYYEKRGPAVGLYAKYRFKDKITSLIRSYLIDDRAYEKNGQKERKTRGRFNMDYVQKITNDVRGLLKLNYLSDNTIMQDFFRDEFQDEIQTENYINIAKTTSWYQLSLMIKKRFHDFYTDLEKLPELTFNILETRIGKTNLLYVGSASVGYLFQRFAESLGQNDYGAARFDTTHQLSYPKKYLGWLNIIPRAGFRETYWSKRAQPETVIVNNIPTIVKKELDKDTWRSIFFTGAEFTTKISKIFYTQSEFWNINQLRHVIEPRVNYVYQHEPTIKAEDLLNFGDLAYKDNHIELGVRNKLQTKRDNIAWNLVDLNVWSNYYPYPDINNIYNGAERVFSNIDSKLELRPFDWIAMDMDASFDEYDMQFDTYNTELVFYKEDKFSFGLGYRYGRDLDKLWTSEINYTINSNWAIRMLHRFEFDSGELQQQEYVLIRDFHCWNVAFSFRQYRQIDETAGFVVFYPKAYPNIPVTFGTTYFGVDNTNKLDLDFM
jgi:RNAse (barnase) inhibitor barstar